MNIWVTSDTHFGHANIIKYCDRPFRSTEEMDKELIKRWNSVVKSDDIVYHLGDFGFGSRERIKELRRQLNGRIYLILGNHDRYPISFYYEAGFNRVYDRPILIQGFYLLSHAPIELLNKEIPFANIYGHVHDDGRYKDFGGNSACVCVERTDYYPIKLEEVQKKITGKEE